MACMHLDGRASVKERDDFIKSGIMARATIEGDGVPDFDLGATAVNLDQSSPVRGFSNNNCGG